MDRTAELPATPRALLSGFLLGDTRAMAQTRAAQATAVVTSISPSIAPPLCERHASAPQVASEIPPAIAQVAVGDVKRPGFNRSRLVRTVAVHVAAAIPPPLAQTRIGLGDVARS